MDKFPAQLVSTTSLVWAVCSLVMIAYSLHRIDELQIEVNKLKEMKSPVINSVPVVNVTEDDVLYGAKSNGNKLFGGVDWCTQVPGIYVPPSEWALDRGSTLCPAATMYGSTLFNGDVFATSSVNILVDAASHRYVNLTKFILDFEQLNSNVCQRTCQHQGVFNPFDCSCSCTDYFTGPSCETPTCAPYGTYNATFGLCDCGTMPETVIHYDSYCRPTQIAEITAPVEECTNANCQGTCLVINNTNTCVCGQDGQFGPNCEYQCATETIDNSKCTERTSWGIDGCYQMPNTNLWSCVCGGGYMWETANSIQVSEMICETQECRDTFTNYSHICCAPGINCYESQCSADDVACCVEFSNTEVGCISAGCSFCNITSNGVSVTTCAAPDFISDSSYANNECTALSPYFTQGNWKTWQYDCGDFNADDVCDRATRDTYLGIYTSTCDTNFNTTCLSDARIAVNAAPWPRLTTSLGYREAVLYHSSLFVPMGYTDIAQLPVASLSETAAPRMCVLDHPDLSYFGSVSVFVTDLGLSNKHMRCIDNFYLISRLGVDGTVEYYTFMLSTQTPYRYCRAKAGQVNRALLIQFFGTDVLDENTLVWRQLYNRETGAYKDYTQYCDASDIGDFSFDVTLKRQPSIWDTTNVGVPDLYTAVQSNEVYSNVITTLSYIVVPYMPANCPTECQSLGTCSGSDLTCLQNKAVDVTWTECCYCLWKHTDAFIHCYGNIA